MNCRRIAEILAEYSGLKLLPLRDVELRAAIAALMKRLHLEDITVLERRLVADRALAQELIEAVVVPETYFFRHAGQFNALRDDLLPDLIRRHERGERLAAWCASCASGEEVYSLAIFLQEQGLDERFALIASDISRRALARARAGVYRPWSLRDVVADLRRRLFESLGPDGWLFTGPSDPLLSAWAAFRTVFYQAGILYQRRVLRRHNDSTRKLDVPAGPASGRGVWFREALPSLNNIRLRAGAATERTAIAAHCADRHPSSIG